MQSTINKKDANLDFIKIKNSGKDTLLGEWGMKR
jgi:hypothetical protein